MNLLVGQEVASFCNSCAASTWHRVHNMLEQRHEHDDGFWEQNTYYTLQCGGCRRVKLREDWSQAGVLDDVVTVHYPPASLRKQPSWMGTWWETPGLKPSVLAICKEVYKALQNDMPHLAAMGVRSALEQVMIDKIGGDRLRFSENLDELFRQGHVSLLMRQRLESVLDAGSATIHRGHTPTKEDLNILVTVMEHIIESLYVHEAEVERMAARIPPRPPRPPRPPKDPA